MKRKTENLKPQPQTMLELKKHVAVIHSSNKLTLLQRKIANALLFNAYGELQSKDEHCIHIAALCELIGYDSHDHKSIKKALVNLLSTVLEWNLVDGERLDSEGIWNASSIIADASIDGPLCTYSYSNKMRKLLYRPHMYGRLDMIVQSQFKSGYGLALYENCNRFQDIGQTPWFDLSKFRKLMGVEEGKYKIFRDFKTRVLDKAVEEVNKYSSFMISPQLRKQSRQVTSIQFIIKKANTALTSPMMNDEETLQGCLKLTFGFSAKQISATIARYEDTYIREKIALVQSAPSFKNGRVKNMARYLLSALRDDYQQPRAIVSSIEQQGAVNSKKKQRDNISKQTEFKRFQENQLLGLFHQLPKRSQSAVLKKFALFLTGMYQQFYLRSGLENLLVQEQLCVFLTETNHRIVEKVPTYDRWLAELKCD